MTITLDFSAYRLAKNASLSHNHQNEKREIILSFSCLLLLISITGADPGVVTPTAVKDSSASTTIPAVEMRGLWVPAWEITTPEATTRVVEKARQYGFNSLFVQVRYRGDRLYIANRAGNQFGNPEPESPSLRQPLSKYDPLADILAKGHGAGLQVHAWVTVYVAANISTPTPKGHPLTEHPDWVMTTEKGAKTDIGNMMWLDPGHPAVNPYLQDVFLDIVQGYEVDGLHLDYVRYPGAAFGYNPAALAQYKKDTGKTPSADPSSFIAWRRGRVEAFVTELGQRMNEIRPGCIFSSAVFGERLRVALPDCLQDWGAWLEKGILDYVITMSYSTKDEDIERQCADYQNAQGQRQIYVGLGILQRKKAKEEDKTKKADKQHSTAGGDTSGNLDSAESVICKINIIRQHSLPGVAVFAYGTLAEDNDARFKALAAGPFARPAALPVLPWHLAPGIFLASLGEGDKQVWTVVTVSGAGKRLAVLQAKSYASKGNKDSFINRSGELYRTCVGKFSNKSDAVDLMKKLGMKGAN